jgi:hypothetical protein
MDPNAERNGIIDVPDIALFSVAKVSELVDAYRNLFDFIPTGICLPVTSAGGLTYKSRLGIKNVAPQREEGLYDLRVAIGEAQREGLQVYLFIDPTLPLATTSPEYNMIDSVGDETPRCCIVNKYTRAVVRQCIEEATSLATSRGVEVAGYAFAGQNMWPLSADGLRLEYNCWCS